MELSNIIHLGIFECPEIDTCVNVRLGLNKNTGAEQLYYMYRDEPVYFTHRDFYLKWKHPLTVSQ